MNNKNFENIEFETDSFPNEPVNSNDNQLIKYCLCALIIAIAIILILVIQTNDFSSETTTSIATENTDTVPNNITKRKIIIDNKIDNSSTTNSVSPNQILAQLSNETIVVVSQDKITIKIPSGNPTSYLYFDENNILINSTMEIVCNSQYEINSYIKQLENIYLGDDYTLNDKTITVSLNKLIPTDRILTKSQVISNLSNDYYIEYEN